MTVVPEKYTPSGRKAINARIAAVSLCAAGGGLALLLGSAGWAMAGLLVWGLSAVVALSAARSSDSKAPLDEAAILSYVKNNPDSALATQLVQALKTEEEKVSREDDDTE